MQSARAHLSLATPPRPFAPLRTKKGGNGNHETGPEVGPYAFDYHEFLYRLAPGQAFLAQASNSTSVRWYSFFVEGTAAFFMLDADAWIYPAVYGLVQGQWEWLAAQLPLVDRKRYPWLVVVPHRAMYCTKTDDGECNSEAEALRYGQLGLFWGLEQLLVQHGVDLVFAGHHHSYQRLAGLAGSGPAPGGAGNLTIAVPCPPGDVPVYKGGVAPVYIDIGTGGAGYSTNIITPQPEWACVVQFWHGFGRLTIHNGSALQWAFVNDADGSVADEAWIMK